jgi:hypothetical protein
MNERNTDLQDQVVGDIRLWQQELILGVLRNLAEQSKQAAGQVKAILADIQRATNATVMAIEQGSKGVDEGVLLATQAQQAIEHLAAVIDESAQAATQMVESSSRYFCIARR